MDNKKEQGFTLIEMLVTVVVFTTLMIIISGIFAQTLDLQRVAFNLQAIEENSRFALETMAREIRFAKLITPSTAECPGTDSLNFTHPTNGEITYSLIDGQIHRTVDGIDTILTSGSVNITKLSFCVIGAEEDDNIQPKITILMSMETGAKNPQDIDLQTTITTRLLDISIPIATPTTAQYEWVQTGTGSLPGFIMQNKACRVNLGEIAIFIPQVITCNEGTIGKHVVADIGFAYVYTSQTSTYWSGFAAAVLEDKSLIRLTSYNSDIVCTGVIIPADSSAGTKYTCQNIAE